MDPKVGVVSEGTAGLISVASAALTTGSTSVTTTTSSPVDKSDDSSAPFFSLWMAMVMFSGIVVIRRKFT
ncbi:MAG: hypothetical protein GPJ54_11450 [Candidatus Heimdallarchaeota archaeon]|nr:hypothetical protein [Candidatus Heimdallarchaeota archaeon]